MAKELASLFVRLGLDDKNFTAGVSNAQKGFEKFGGIAARTLIAAGAAITAYAATSIKAFIQVGNEIDKLSKRTGIGAESLSQLKYAFESNDVSIDALDNAMKGIANTLDSAIGGSKDA